MRSVKTTRAELDGLRVNLDALEGALEGQIHAES